jgi:hypothetical protein
MCINPTCSEYSIADQVFIKSDGANVIMIISDSKIKSSTDYTGNQKTLRANAKKGLASNVLQGASDKKPLIKNPANDNNFSHYKGKSITVLTTLKIHSENGDPNSNINVVSEQLK